MKKFRTLLFIFFISISSSNSQWVTIPDTNFAAFLQQNYPQCMNGSLMDTTCSAIVNEDTLKCINKNIADLTGIEYFNNLIFLDCTFNQLTTLPKMTDSLNQLICRQNLITILPILPLNLTKLDCWGNFLFNLPTLPNNLTYLECAYNSLNNLPSLPSGLKNLYCNDNLLSSLPLLPDSLEVLACSTSPTASVKLTSLPNLPNNLNALVCSNHLLTTLPNLPQSIKTLYCDNNLLTNLPTLPDSIIILHIGNPGLSLPILPNTLAHLRCWNMQLINLPALPNTLIYLNCNLNQLTSLPTLPPFLKYLESDDNLLNSLPSLPSTLLSITCSNNLLTSIPELPDSLINLYVNDNPNLTCLPKHKKIRNFNYSNTAIQCLPNYPQLFGFNPIVNPPLSTYPLCDIFNNPNNCDVYWNISGKAYADANSNCIDDAGEQGLSNLKLQLFQNSNLIQQVYSSGEGLYSFDTDTGTFTYTVDTTDLPIHVTCPTSSFHTSVLTLLDSMDYNMDFAMQCKPGFDVGVKNIVRQSGQLFPGNNAIIKIGAGDMASFYGLACASGVSGSVSVDFTGPITFISEVPGALIPSVIGNTLTYTIADFGLINFNSDFRIIVQTDTSAQAGQQVCFTVNVTPTTGDNDVTNNSLQHCFTVVNSFDPNAKEVYPEGGLTPGQEWITYTIQFQNTGNAPAQNIYILDTLDQNLIPETFTLLSYSHEPLTQLFGNVIKFNFPNINLPDSTNDEPNSHGFVQYKLKLAQNLPVGTVISNTAYNFFDFNSPVATNTVSNTVGVTSVINISNKIDFSVFPNPTTDEIKISFNLNSSSEIEIELYNSLGQNVKIFSKAKYEAGKHIINFSVANLPVGVYHLKFSADDQVVVKRVVKL